MLLLLLGACNLPGTFFLCDHICCIAAYIRVRPALADEGRYFVRVPKGTIVDHFAADHIRGLVSMHAGVQLNVSHNAAIMQVPIAIFLLLMSRWNEILRTH